MSERLPVRKTYKLFVGGAFTWLYAHALGRHGVAFQRQPDGSIRPKTVAVRRVLAQPGGAGTMMRGLRAAWFGRSTAVAAVEKR